MLLGFIIYKKGGNLTIFTIIAVALMYLSMIVGNFIPVEMPSLFGLPSTGVWTIILLIYAFFASVMPVTSLLQPRDFINAYQLAIAMTLIILGIIFSSIGGELEIVAPAIQMKPADAPPMLPFLFITIACGAISGFHSLVSSGTSAKQVRQEDDSLFVGYGSMLLEGALATLVVIAVAAGIGMGYKGTDGQMLNGVAAWTNHYSSWAVAQGLGSKIGAFVEGASNMIGTLGIPKNISLVIMGVFVASFAGTTLDTATRIQRYVVTELFSRFKNKIFSNRYIVTFFVVLTAAILAFATGADGKGALSLWPLFGAVNQTLAALALIIITLYLKPKGKNKWMVAGIPALFMSVITFWATIMNQNSFMSNNEILLSVVNGIIMVIVLWVTIEGIIKFFQLHKTTKY